MYKEIENFYKKRSPFNVIKRKTFILYIIVVFLLWIFNINNFWLLMIITVLAMVFFMKRICEKELKTKLHISIGKKIKNEKCLQEIIDDREREIFKEYLNKNKLYDKEIILLIIEHYRNQMKMKLIGSNLLSVISIVVSIALTFVSKDGFNFNNFVNALPYLISLFIMTIIIYFSIKSIGEIKLFVKGEDGIFERIEAIFSEIYIEYINELNNKNDKIIKNSKKQTQKQINSKPIKKITKV